MKFSKRSDDLNKKLPPSRFSYEELDGLHYVTEIKSGISAEMYKAGDTYKYRNFDNEGTATPERLAELGQAMVTWFIYRIIKGK